MLKLRNFLYLNIQLVDDFIAAIDGYVYDEEEMTNKHVTTKSGEVAAKIPVVGGQGNISGTEEAETKKNVRRSDAAKFQQILDYLSENDSAKYYETMTEMVWEDICREDIIEIYVSVRFSKIKELAMNIAQLESLAKITQPFMENELIDKDAQSKLDIIKSLGDSRNNELPCIFVFQGTKNTFEMVAYLDEKYLRVPKESFVGEFNVLCKVQRKIAKGEKIEIDNLFEGVKNLPVNRAQRRKMPKNLQNPTEIRDVVKGPAAVVTPIAIYQ